MQTFEFRKSDHHKPSDPDINDGNKDRWLYVHDNPSPPPPKVQDTDSSFTRPL